MRYRGDAPGIATIASEHGPSARVRSSTSASGPDPRRRERVERMCYPGVRHQ